MKKTIPKACEETLIRCAYRSLRPCVLEIERGDRVTVSG